MYLIRIIISSSLGEVLVFNLTCILTFTFLTHHTSVINLGIYAWNIRPRGTRGESFEVFSKIFDHHCTILFLFTIWFIVRDTEYTLIGGPQEPSDFVVVAIPPPHPFLLLVIHTQQKGLGLQTVQKVVLFLILRLR